MLLSPHALPCSAGATSSSLPGCSSCQSRRGSGEDMAFLMAVSGFLVSPELSCAAGLLSPAGPRNSISEIENSPVKTALSARLDDVEFFTLDYPVLIYSWCCPKPLTPLCPGGDEVSVPLTFLRYLLLVSPRTEPRISQSVELIQHSRICFSKSFFFHPCLS